jgi:hypothetical protein
MVKKKVSWIVSKGNAMKIHLGAMEDGFDASFDIIWKKEITNKNVEICKHACNKKNKNKLHKLKAQKVKQSKKVPVNELNTRL